MEHHETLEDRENNIKTYYFEEGYKQGFKEGYKEGFKESFKERREKTIQTLLSNGVDPEFIAKNLNLRLEEVLTLCK